MGGGVLALAIGGVQTWRAQRTVRARIQALSELVETESERLLEVAERLNRHGFEIQHTMDDLAPKLAVLGMVLRHPLVAATTPWVIRRVLGRPLKRRH